MIACLTSSINGMVALPAIIIGTFAIYKALRWREYWREAEDDADWLANKLRRARPFVAPPFDFPVAKTKDSASLVAGNSGKDDPHG